MGTDPGFSKAISAKITSQAWLEGRHGRA